MSPNALNGSPKIWNTEVLMTALSMIIGGDHQVGVGQRYALEAAKEKGRRGAPAAV